MLDEEALARDFAAIGEIGRSPLGGYDRIAYSAADREARDWLVGAMRELGLDVREDAIGNVIGRYPGTEARAPIAIGSHTDSVPSGGNYDGILGILGGLAALRTVIANGVRLRHPIELIDFAGEEATMPGGTVGSRAMAGLLPPGAIDAPAFDGRTLGEHLRAFGLEPARIHEAQRPRSSFAAYLELHVEQGGVLEAEGISIGVVTGIVGIRRYTVTFNGAANHAGTTPMLGRRDALVAGAPYVSEVRRIAIEHEIVGTVGMLHVEPGAPSVIPGRVVFELEIRGLDPVALDAAETALAGSAAKMGAEFTQISAKSPTESAREIMDCVDSACEELALPRRTMPSGAGHDAMCIAALAPQGMIFVPSRDGISHAPAEFTEHRDCVAGARVLLGTLLAADATFE